MATFGILFAKRESSHAVCLMDLAGWLIDAPYAKHNSLDAFPNCTYINTKCDVHCEQSLTNLIS